MVYSVCMAKKLTDEQKQEVVKRYLNGERVADLAVAYKCSGGPIYAAINNEFRSVAKDETKVLREQLNDAMEALARIKEQVKAISKALDSIL